MNPPALSCRHLTVTYGAVRALDEVTLDIASGGVTGIIGPNGAGKTTLVDAVTGFATVAEGCVEFEGRDVTRLAPHKRARLGLARTWQTAELFEDLTVRENLQVAGVQPRWWHALLDAVRPRGDRLVDERIAELAELLGLEPFLDARPGDLPTGLRRLVGIARGLVRRPAVLLLDEPAAGLDSAESRALGERLRTIATGGPALVLVDHDVSLVWSACDLVAVLDFGHLIAVGSPAEVRLDDRVLDAYLGRPER
jgi:branched-chain amino acid transport system ATP-binding protein